MRCQFRSAAATASRSRPQQKQAAGRAGRGRASHVQHGAAVISTPAALLRFCWALAGASKFANFLLK